MKLVELLNLLAISEIEPPPSPRPAKRPHCSPLCETRSPGLLGPCTGHQGFPIGGHTSPKTSTAKSWFYDKRIHVTLKVRRSDPAFSQKFGIERIPINEPYVYLAGFSYGDTFQDVFQKTRALIVTGLYDCRNRKPSLPSASPAGLAVEEGIKDVQLCYRQMQLDSVSIHSSQNWQKQQRGSLKRARNMKTGSHKVPAESKSGTVLDLYRYDTICFHASLPDHAELGIAEMPNLSISHLHSELERDLAARFH